MKYLTSLVFGLLFGALPASALTIVASAIAPESRISNATGTALPSGCYCQIGSLNFATDAAVTQRATKAGLASLMVGFTAFSDQFTVGTGAANTAGQFEIALHKILAPSEATAFQNKPIYLLILNAPTAAEATECAILRLGTQPFTADTPDTPFLDAQPMVSLSEATVLLGSKDAQGIHTVAFPQTTYLNWAIEMLPGASTANVNPAADPDSDGISNWLEYALGGNPLKPDVQILPQIVTADGESKLMWQEASHLLNNTLKLIDGSTLPTTIWSPTSTAPTLRTATSLPPGLKPWSLSLPTNFSIHFWSLRISP